MTKRLSGLVWFVLLPAMVLVVRVPDAPGQPAWQAEWNRLVQASKKEGRVVVWGGTGDDVRLHMVDAFQKEFPWLRVDFLGLGGGVRTRRILEEWKAGVLKLDLAIGTPTDNLLLKPRGFIKPVMDYLISPEIKDPSKWREGEFHWTDKEKQFLLIAGEAVRPSLAVHSSVNPAELRSWRDLLSSKWRGKIVFPGDPRRDGPAWSLGLLFYYGKGLGPTYAARFWSETGVVMQPDQRQALEWIVAGRYLIVLNPDIVEYEKLLEIGKAPRLIVDLATDGPGTELTNVHGANTALLVPNMDQPHPNAAKLYLNWWYSKKGGDVSVKLRRIPSRRTDVDNSVLPSYVVPKPAIQYLLTEFFTEPEQTNPMREHASKHLPTK